jgi:SAM-dependent methyltransferase
METIFNPWNSSGRYQKYFDWLDNFKIEIMKDSNYDFIRNYELETWTRCSSSYLDTWGVLTNKMLPELVKATNIKSGDRVLDIGCGPGNSSNLINEIGAEVTGIDFSQKMVDVAIANYPKITFQQADAENIPIPDNAFDVIIANYVVHHLPNPEKVFSEISRVLQPGGRFVFSVWGPSEEQSTME